MNYRKALGVGLLAGWISLGSLARAADPAPGAVPDVAAQPPAETPEQRDARMKWWREARFGMFIHWGLYAVPAGTWDGKKIAGIGEWIMNRGKIPVADYAKFAEQFNPTQFDADRFAQVAQDAGMKYMVITAKHHDGFCMFHTGVDGYNIYDATPFKRDPVKELSEACPKHGIKFGVYYSQAQDWHHPGGAANGGHWDKAQEGDFDDYLRTVSLPQVKELLSTIHPAVLWFDTPTNMTPERAAQFLPVLHDLAPEIIYNNRLGGGVKGDTETPEQFIPPTGYPGRDWETCMTINDTWGYKSYDTNFKSAQTLIRNLINTASKGGNYLLNVGPDATGVIPQPEVDRLEAVGRWLKTNGDAIYATSASPFKRLSWGRATQKPGKLYLEVFDWPADGKLVVPVKSKVTSAYLLADPSKKLEVSEPGEQGVTITVPATAPDADASVVVAEVDGAVDALPPDLTVRADGKDGSLVCGGDDAMLSGSNLKLGAQRGGSDIEHWSAADDSAKWTADVQKPGEYEVSITYSTEAKSADAPFEVTVGDQKVQATLTPTKSRRDFGTVSAGTVKIDSPGKVTVTVKPAGALAEGTGINLRSVTLKPKG